MSDSLEACFATQRESALESGSSILNMGLGLTLLRAVLG